MSNRRTPRGTFLHGEILYIKADSNYSCIHLVGGGRQVVCETLGNFKSMENLFRIHKNTSVNLTEIKSWCENVIEMSDGSKHILSRRKLKLFLSLENENNVWNKPAEHQN